MSTKSYTFIPYRLQDHKVQSWKKIKIPSAQGIQLSFGGGQKNNFLSRYGLRDFKFLFLGWLGTCLQNLMPTQGVEPWENHKFPQGGIQQFTYKDRSLTIKIAYEKFLDWKSK
jgi:hypothetical protein